MELERARCLVAGATSELGSRLARRLSAEGALLALAGRNEQVLGRLGDELDAPTARFDATVVASCHEAVESLAGALGGLDAVIVVPCGTSDAERAST